MLAEANTPLAYLPWVLAAGAAVFVVFGQRGKQARADLQESVTALQGRLLAAQDEIRGLSSTNDKQAVEIQSTEQQLADLRTQVATLGDVVTARAEIDQLANVTHAGFIHLGVPAEVLSSKS